MHDHAFEVTSNHAIEVFSLCLSHHLDCVFCSLGYTKVVNEPNILPTT